MWGERFRVFFIVVEKSKDRFRRPVKEFLTLIKHLYGGGQLPWVIPPRFFKNCRNKCLVISCSVTITKYIAFQFTRSLTELHHLLHTIRDKTAFCCIQTRVSSRNAFITCRGRQEEPAEYSWWAAVYKLYSEVVFRVLVMQQYLFDSKTHVFNSGVHVMF